MSVHLRQVGEYDPRELEDKQVIIYGCGSVGSHVAYALLKAGYSILVLVDPDRVEAHNLPSHLHPAWATGEPKATSLADYLALILPNHPALAPINSEQIQSGHLISDEIYFVLAVDSIEARRSIYRTIKERFLRLLSEDSKALVVILDPRMGFKYWRILVANSDLFPRYEDSLIHPGQGEPCRKRTIITTVLSLSSLVAQYILDLSKGKEVPFETWMSLSGPPQLIIPEGTPFVGRLEI